MRTIEAMAGSHIRDVLAEAVEIASEGVEVGFSFNGREFQVKPDETLESAKARWSEVAGYPVLTREEELEKLRQDREEREAAYEKARAEAGAPTEQEMREADVPWLDTPEELGEYIEALVSRPHDYGTCVYAMSMAAVAAFQYVARKLVVTGFQASCADMDILRRTRRMDDGFRIVNYRDLLYPQHWDEERSPIFRAALAERPEYWADKAKELMDQAGDHVARQVWNHWQDLTRGEVK